MIFDPIIVKIGNTSDFSVPLIVNVEAGAVVTATNGDTVLTETASSDGTVTFILPKPGDWELTAVLDGEEMYPEVITIPAQYSSSLSFTGTVKEFPYLGEVQTLSLMKGRYKLEVWGAEGGYRTSDVYGGKGGYSEGELKLDSKTTLFVYVGGSGNTGGPAGGFNGGGKRDTYNGGGGASDIRIGVDDLNHRVIVAGGGGSDGAANKAGGYGGGKNGESRTDSYGTGGFGGTQTGVSDSTWQTNVQSSGTANQPDAYGGFGFGGNGVTTNSQYPGAGGGGWYGGSGSVPDSSGDDDRGGGGGSGFVWTGQSVPSGFSLEEKYQLNTAETKNGAQSFVSPSGEQETGHSGDGYIRITPIVPPPPRLPEGYTELQYISCNNYVSFPTEISTITGKTKVVMDMTPEEKIAANRTLFIANYGSAAYFYLSQTTTANQMECCVGESKNNTKFTYDLAKDVRTQIYLDTANKKLVIGSSNITINSLSGNYVSGPLYICGYGNSSAYGLKMKIHSVQVSIGDTLMGDFVPCKSPDEKVGLYDLVKDSFIESVGTNSAVTPGPEI